jgi:hypothetical protein
VLRTRKIALAVFFAALAVAPAIALGSSSRSATNSTSYPDSIGEDALAPDITTTTVSNDDTGLITFQVAISNRPALTPDMLIAIVLDSDSNTATGDPQGAIPGFAGSDYLIQLVPGEVDLFKWNGSDYVFAAAPSLIYAYDTTGATIKLNATELGKPKTLSFAEIALSGITNDAQGNSDFTNAHRDFSPDPGHGTFTYQVQIKVTLSVVAFTTSPKPVKAGKPFSVGLAVDESDTGGAVAQGTIACVAKIAGKRVQLRTSRLVKGVAVCAWTAPKTAKGKRIQGSITLSTQGAQVSRNFSFKVT